MFQVNYAVRETTSPGIAMNTVSRFRRSIVGCLYFRAFLRVSPRYSLYAIRQQLLCRKRYAVQAFYQGHR